MIRLLNEKTTRVVVSKAMPPVFGLNNIFSPKELTTGLSYGAKSQVAVINNGSLLGLFQLFTMSWSMTTSSASLFDPPCPL